MKYLIFILFLIVSIQVTAKDSQKMVHKQHEHHEEHKHDAKHSHKDSTASVKKFGKEKVVIKVKGMVCAFCAQGITKNFNKLSSVKETKVDLKTMEVTVQLNKGKELREDVIKKVVTDAGFSYVGTK
ncbi:MAG: heavy-metal-associated domain-containing protein [Bdellovibrionales bacterium]|nr:cation transporter [Bdellovibrionales bacterium]NQZ17952.1 heavy-metal-associated domain-containing protein [Bdellovibrionales bacterium]